MKKDKEVKFKTRLPFRPLKEVTPFDLKRIKIGRSFTDLARLGLIGEYEMVEATPICPRLYYRFDYIGCRWEIYAVDKDLIGYNLLHNGADGHRLNIVESRVDVIETIIEPTDEPTEEPTEDPTEDPTEEPTVSPYTHSKIDQSADKVGGNLEKVIDGGILILSGLIKWYEKDDIRFLADANYVGVSITPDPRMLSQYGDDMALEYRGSVFGKEIFKNGIATFYINISCPGQEVPITIFWNDEFIERFVVAITQESKLEVK